MTSNRSFGLIVAALTFALDQGVKYLIMGPVDLPNAREIELLPIFKIIWVNNPGVSMGMLTATTPLQAWGLVALTAAIAAGVAVWMWRERRREDVLGLGMILGGAIGNIVDRVRFGHVIDYANLHFGDFSPFLVFNVADAAITVGVMILFFRALLSRDKPKAEPNA